MGPLISRTQLDRVRSYVPDTLDGIRGKAPEGPGYWFPPTVLTGVRPDDRVAVEEVFGPVAVVLPFDDEADAVRLANATDYGLMLTPCGPGTSAAPCASPAPCAPGTCPSTPIPACATGPPSAGSSSPAWAASWARTP